MQEVLSSGSDSEKVDILTSLMPVNEHTFDIQRIQTAFRIKLVDAWKIPTGARILEIGCGQGDMTLVLADAVGPTGSVLAIDLAGPEYGSPLTLGQSTGHLRKGPLGSRIEFRFNCDVLDPTVDFPPNSFDAIVLANCSWYFESIPQLSSVFTRIAHWGSRLCFSEWDLEPRSLSQVGHMLAVLIQGHLQLYRTREMFNARTPTSRSQVRQILEETSWKVQMEETLFSEGLQDAGWEVANTLRAFDVDQTLSGESAKAREILQAQVDVLRQLSLADLLPLDCFAMTAFN